MIAGILLAVTALLLVGSFVKRTVLYDPKVPFLCSNGRAQWIIFDREPVATVQVAGNCASVYRKRIVVEKTPAKALMDVCAMKRLNVLVDGNLVFMAGENLNDWKRVHTIDLAPYVTPGQHEIGLMVYNWSGPTCARVSCPALGLFTGPDWEASPDGQLWSQARTVEEPRPYVLSRALPRADQVFLSKLPFFIPTFLLVFLLVLDGRLNMAPGLVRWWLVAAWALLALNNIIKLPPYLGFDITGHMQYIRYIADQGRIPLANEGWEMHQSPLFYILGALFYKVFGIIFSDDTLVKALRILPLAAGIAQVEIGYRIVRRVYPERKDLQILGLIFAGLLPMNVYMSQYVSNAPLVAFFESLVVLWCVRLLCEKPPTSMRSFAVLGCFLGLALLTKMTAIVLIVPAFVVVVIVSLRSNKPGFTAVESLHGQTDLKTNTTGESKPTENGTGEEINPRISIKKILKHVAVSTGIMLGTASLTSGWYYLRNWRTFVRPFIGDWDVVGFQWWQDPGFRTPHDFLTFGEALFYPVYAGIMGFWDGLYSTLWADGFVSSMVYRLPPWNYDFMLSSVWLALLPTTALFLGAIIALRSREPALLFAFGCVAMFGAALTWLFLTTPFLCAVKSFYALGITPCLALLAVAGFEVITRGKWLRAVVYGGFACWALASYLSYFVI